MNLTERIASRLLAVLGRFRPRFLQALLEQAEEDSHV
jgi:hypothetical protein